MRTGRLAHVLRLLPALSLLWAASAAAAPPMAAQPARLVKDIATETGSAKLQANELAAFRSSAFFGAADERSSEQLWTSDGTAGGTRKISDFDAAGFQWPSHFTSVGERLYFFTGPRLWWTDGSGAVFFVRDLPGTAWRTAALDDVLIVHTLGEPELWRSDGTSEGTYRLTNILPDLRLENWLTRAGDVVYFFTTDPPSGQLSIWSTDGTNAGTRFRVGIGAQILYEASALGDRLFFVTTADPYQGPFQLWRSDGTIPGTEPVGTFAGDPPGVCPMNCGLDGPGSLTPLDGTMYFVANDGVHGRELWRSDGTASGTSRVRGDHPASDYVSWGLVAAGPRIYFMSTDAEHGTELWSSDGTAGGTALVFDATPGPDSSIGSLYAALGDQVVFARSWFDDLWISDGPSDAHPLADLTPGDGGIPFGFAPVGGSLLFVEPETLTGGTRLWTTDGTAAGTRVLDPFEGPRGSHPANFTPGGERMMFVPADETAWRDRPRTEMWVTDGTENGTSRVASFEQVGLDVSGTTSWLDGIFYFSARASSHEEIELWRSDGTPGGTARVRDVGGPIGPESMTPAGHTLFFTARDDAHGSELWATDGTADGTRVVRDIRPGTEDTRLVGLVAEGDRVFFIADDGVHGEELWVSDGTEEGTFLVFEIRPGPEGNAFQGMTAARGRVFLGAYDGTAFGLWTSDGTAAGTRTLGPFDPHQLTAAGGLVYFTDNWLRELWRSDGTTEGTFRVAEIHASDLVGGAHVLYFIGFDPAHGAELWRSDGTEAGTRLIRDIRTGPGHAMVAGSASVVLATAGDLAVFAANDGVYGFELWASDGTEAGTFQVQDISAGVPSSNPTAFTLSGELVYFSADDGVTGQELWAVPERALRFNHPRGLEPPAHRQPATRDVPERPSP